MAQDEGGPRGVRLFRDLTGGLYAFPAHHLPKTKPRPRRAYGLFANKSQNWRCSPRAHTLGVGWANWLYVGAAMKLPGPVKQLIKRFVPDEMLERRRKASGGYHEFAFDPARSIREDIAQKYDFTGDLLDFYSGNTGPIVQKWHHYIPLYDRYFAPYRNRPIRFLEIGVSEGGSLQMWRKYFGAEAIIFGIDINPDCARFDGQAGQVRIGSQADRAFLENVVAEMGGVDVVLDDGSHQMEHIRASLEVLFPQVNPGGIYMVEDLHCAYWSRFGGGLRAEANFFGFARELTDDLHDWYHGHRRRHPAISNACSGVHVHDSICVLDRAANIPPVHSRVGQS